MDLRRQGGLKIKVVLLMSGDKRVVNKTIESAQRRMLNANRLKYQEHGFQVFTLQGDIVPGPQAVHSLMLSNIVWFFWLLNCLLRYHTTLSR